MINSRVKMVLYLVVLSSLSLLAGLFIKQGAWLLVSILLVNILIVGILYYNEYWDRKIVLEYLESRMGYREEDEGVRRAVESDEARGD